MIVCIVIVCVRLGNTWLTRVYGGLNSRRAVVVSSAQAKPSGGFLLSNNNPRALPPGTSQQHVYGPKMNRVLNDEVVTGVQALIDHMKDEIGDDTVVLDPSLIKIRPASIIPGMEGLSVPDPNTRMSFHDRELFGMDAPPESRVVSQQDAMKAWNRPFTRPEVNETPSGTPYQDALEDFMVVKRVSEARQRKCAVSGNC